MEELKEAFPKPYRQKVVMLGFQLGLLMFLL
jgi:hypothetical protein